MKIPFSPPDITEEEVEQVAEALRSGWITTGPKTKELERQVANFCGTSRAVCLNSQTACAEMTLRLLGVTEGDEVIVPAYTYTATASVVCHVGAKLVMVDVQDDSLEMNYDKLADAITEKTKVDDSLKEEYGNRIHFLIYGTKKYPIRYIFKFILNSFISLYYFFRYQPEVIVTTGTHTAVPMCYIAKIFGSKVIFIETFANRTVGTVAGRLVYPIADTFVVQWEELHKVYPKSVCWGWIY